MIKKWRYHSYLNIIYKINLNSNTKKCSKVHSKVKQEIKELLHEKKKKLSKTKKVTKMNKIQARLCDILGGSQRDVIDKDDDDDDDFCIYLVDMHPNE